MRRFIRAAGGRVRFDAFACEHLVGDQHGFYSQRIDLSAAHGPVPTPINSSKEYLALYADLVLRSADQIAMRKDSRHVVVCEFGPGGGELHKAICAEFDRRKGQHAFRRLDTLNYVAVDPNGAHLEAVKKAGASGVLGTLQKSTLDAHSVDVIIAEEVRDTLPYRALRRDPDQHRFIGELFVEEDKGEIKLVLEAVDSSEELAVLQQFLASRDFKDLRYDYTPEAPAVWEEMRRILTPQGVAILGDYSLEENVSRRNQAPQFTELFAQEIGVSQRPYRCDLTHHVHFSLHAACARAAGFAEVSIFDPLNIPSGATGRARTSLAITLIAGGRLLLVASGSRVGGKDGDPDLTARLYALADTTPGCRNVIRALAPHPKAAEVVAVFERHGLRGGAFWGIYSDMANRDIDQFVDLVLGEDPGVIAHAKRGM